MNSKQHLATLEVIDFLVSQPSLDQIVAFKPSDRSEDRLSELLSMNRNGALSDSDRAELDQYLWVNHLMNMLKIRVRQKMADADEV
jgi:hypothetical protein